MHLGWLRFAAGAALVLGWAAGRASDGLDDFFGLPDDAGREEVMTYCGACHSVRLVAQQGLARAQRTEVLVSMYEDHEMDPLEDEDARLILDYLGRHVGPENQKRRLRELGIARRRTAPEPNPGLPPVIAGSGVVSGNLARCPDACLPGRDLALALRCRYSISDGAHLRRSARSGCWRRTSGARARK